MRVNFTTATATLALLAAAALPTADALASAGGASAPSSATAATPTVHATGIATWFGPGFYGKKTACGQMLTPGVVGVANRRLPCGTLVKVTYNGHALTIPVLDRGPYSHIGADWDLTAGAASALGITETVRVHAQVVGRTANVPTLGAPAISPAAVLAGGSLAG
jgi:rare lipoprotein A